MKIKVYQIDTEKDTNRVIFFNYQTTLKLAGKVDASIYKTVFDGSVDCKSLDGVFSKFNNDRLVTLQGHSLSVSDIIEVVGDSETVENGIYFCDSFGFKKLNDEFNSNVVSPMQGIKMLVVEPHIPPYEALILDDYKAFQCAVDGNFQILYNGDNTIFICNEEGKIKGLEGNREVNDDIIVGTFLITADAGDGTVKNLSDEQIAHYTQRFAEDETYTQDEIEDSMSYGFLTM